MGRHDSRPQRSSRHSRHHTDAPCISPAASGCRVGCRVECGPQADRLEPRPGRRDIPRGYCKNYDLYNGYTAADGRYGGWLAGAAGRPQTAEGCVSGRLSAAPQQLRGTAGRGKSQSRPRCGQTTATAPRTAAASPSRRQTRAPGRCAQRRRLSR